MSAAASRRIQSATSSTPRGRARDAAGGARIGLGRRCGLLHHTCTGHMCDDVPVEVGQRRCHAVGSAARRARWREEAADWTGLDMAGLDLTGLDSTRLRLGSTRLDLTWWRRRQLPEVVLVLIEEADAEAAEGRGIRLWKARDVRRVMWTCAHGLRMSALAGSRCERRRGWRVFRVYSRRGVRGRWSRRPTWTKWRVGILLLSQGVPPPWHSALGVGGERSEDRLSPFAPP